MQRTPGPWQALGPAEWAGDDGQWIVPGVAMCGKGELSQANAHLIAAAPDLYEYVASSASAGCATAKALLEKINSKSEAAR